MNSIKIHKERNFIICFLFVLVIIIYFSFGIFHIGKFETVDERHWIYDRIPRYWKGILSQQWKLTYIHEKPGITLSIISGTALLKYDNPSGYKEANKPAVTGETSTIEKFLAAFRLPFLIFNGVFSLFFFWIIRKITGNQWISLWSSILILLSPVLLGISRIVNADAVLWTFSAASILSFVAFLETLKKKFVALTALFLGLSMLTKFTAVILLPFLFIITLIFYLDRIREWIDNKIDIPKKIILVSFGYLFAVLGSIIVFAILLPASFMDWKYLYKGTIGYPGMQFVLWPILLIQIFMIVIILFLRTQALISILLFIQNTWKRISKFIYIFLFLSFFAVIVNYLFGNDFLRLENVPFDSREAKIFHNNLWIKKFLLELRPVVFSLTPLVLISLLYLWVKSFFKTTRENFLVIVISTFLIVFSAAVIQQNLLNTIRYSIMVYPLLSILAAIGLYDFISIKKNQKISRFLISTAIIFFSFLSLWLIKPFYLNYTSELLPKKYVITDAWGYGGYEAAQFLNTLPNAKNTPIWSDRGGVCEFYAGPCVKSACELPNGYDEFDYYVLTRRGKILHIKDAAPYYKNEKRSDYQQCKKQPDIYSVIKKQYESSNSVFELFIDSRPVNYIRITKT